MLNLVIEVMPEKFLNYLPVTVINNLPFVSMYTRQVIFKKFKDVYYLSTGLTSEKHWYSIVQKAAQDLFEVELNEKFFDPVFFSYHFDYEERFCTLPKKFRIRLSLFSVCMHFLRCIRSCKRVPNSPSYRKACSIVRDFHFNCRSSFRNIQVTSYGTTLLGLGSDQVRDLDVFVSNADDDDFKFFQLQNDYCNYFAFFHILKKFLQPSHLF